MAKIVQISTSVFPVIQETTLGNSMTVLARTCVVDDEGRAWMLKPSTFGGESWVRLPNVPESDEPVGIN